jgi:octaprenyl-diphosphate synthase
MAQSGGDAADFDFGEVLTMALMLLIVLATAHLENFDLGMTTLSDHFGRNGSSGNEGGADLDRLALANHQNLVKRDFSAYISRYLFYFDFFASDNAILLAAGFYDRIHDELLQMV